MELFYIIGILSVFQLAVLLIILTLKGNKKQAANRIFSSFLLVNILLIISSLLYNSGNLQNPVIILGSFTIFFLLGPLVYYFFRLTFYPLGKPGKFFIIHLIPLLLYASYFTYDLLIRRKQEIPTSANRVFRLNDVQFLVWCLIAYGQLLFYILLSFRILRNYKTILYNQSSTIDKNSLSWSIFVITVYFFHWFFDMSGSFLSISGLVPYSTCIYISVLATGCLLLFATTTVIKGMNGFDLLSLEKNKTRYANSTLSASEKEAIKTKILATIETEKLHLEPELTITALSDKISEPVKSISQVINESFNCNFFDFINGIRIKESKQRIQDNNKLPKPLTISEIMYESGFNSKSAFNRAFKKHTGLTPTEFKKEHQ